MAKKKTKAKRITVYRSPKTGRFVTKKYAKKKPRSIRKETVRIRK